MHSARSDQIKEDTRTWLEGRCQLLQVLCRDIHQPGGVQAQPAQGWHGVPVRVVRNKYMLPWLPMPLMGCALASQGCRPLRRAKEQRQEAGAEATAKKEKKRKNH